MTLTPPRPGADAARARGLKRARASTCVPLERTDLPAAVPPAMVLALLTRQRQHLVDAGELKPRRLYDVRTFKSVLVVLEQLRRLGAVEKSGTFATSMGQLVAGQAQHRPGWKMDGERFADRDRHQSRMREWLDVLEECGVLTWRAGFNLEEEPARTEIRLRPAPEISPEELAVAKDRLRAWKHRYGRALNTGSGTGVRGAARRGQPLSAEQAADKARDRCTKKARARAAGLASNPAPPFGASTTSQDDRPSATPRDRSTAEALSSEAARISDACGTATGVMRTDAPQGSRPSGTAASDQGAIVVAARDRSGNGLIEAGGFGSSRVPAGASDGPQAPVPGSVEPSGPPIDLAGLLERVRAREAALEATHGLLAQAIERRAQELAAWPHGRPVPRVRLREAWTAALAGSMAAAQAGGQSPAAAIGAEDLERLQRARRRYTDHAHYRPAHLPEHPIAALLALTAAAAQHGAPAGTTLRGAIHALDKLSKRMRAHATAGSADHYARAAQRARQRLEQRQTPTPGRIQFRAAPQFPWPHWMDLDADGNPRFAPVLVPRLFPGPDGRFTTEQVLEHRLQLDPDWPAPAANTEQWQLRAREAYLLAGLPLPQELDGRQLQAAREHGHLPPSDWHNARQAGIPLELYAFIQHTGIPLDAARQIPADDRAQVMRNASQRRADQARTRGPRSRHDRDGYQPRDR